MNPEGITEQLQDWANLFSQQLLASDPICSQRLAKLAGQSVEVACTQPEFTCYADITDQASTYMQARRPHQMCNCEAGQATERALVNDGKAAVKVNGDETLLLELVSILGSFAQTRPCAG